jgi:hypothetical protein
MLLCGYIQNSLDEMAEITKMGMMVFSREEQIYVLKANYADNEFYIYKEEDMMDIKRFLNLDDAKEFITDGCVFKE